MGLVIEHVTKRFGKMTAVNDISLELESGKMLGFLGRNGAGKTTTFRMILGSKVNQLKDTLRITVKN